MWNATEHTVSELDIGLEHMRVLETAIADPESIDAHIKHINKALDYFSIRCLRRGGINQMRYGLRERKMDDVTQGLQLLKKHLAP